MRIGTWNVEYARPSRLDRFRAMVNLHHADIWILTETHDDLAPIGLGFCVHSAPRPRESRSFRNGNRWVSIWSRYPIVTTEQFELVDAERTTLAVVQVRPDKRMVIYGTVMPWKGDRGKMDWSEHHRVIQQQSDEWRRVQKAFPDADLCVAGDFNTDMGTGSYYGTKVGIKMLRSGLEKCGLFCATEYDRVPSGGLLHAPIDHIAIPAKYDGRTKVVAAWDADKRQLSDHSGIVVELSET